MIVVFHLFTLPDLDEQEITIFRIPEVRWEFLCRVSETNCFEQN
jgi:hypothetical protein